jgi:hypothetical protein
MREPIRLTDENIADLEEMIKLASQGVFDWGTHYSDSHEEAAAWFVKSLAYSEVTDLQMVVVDDTTGSKIVALTGNGPKSARNARLIASLLRAAPSMLDEIKDHRAHVAHLALEAEADAA